MAGKNTKIIQHVVIIAIALIVGLLVTTVAWGASFYENNKHKAETPNEAGFASTGVLNCVGGEAPETTEELDGLQIPLNHVTRKRGYGKIAGEKHLATTADTVGKKTVTSSIEKHLEATNFFQNCSGCNAKDQSWELGTGQGSAKLGTIPPEHEAWFMNTRWNNDGSDSMPSKGYSIKAGTRIIMHAEKTKRAVVLVAGYEWGPGYMPRIAGASQEAMATLGIGTDDTVLFGFAKDQSLVPGTVYGECVPSVSNVSGSGGSSFISMPGEFTPPFGERTKMIGNHRNSPHAPGGIFGIDGFSKANGDGALDFSGTGDIYAGFDGVVYNAKDVHISQTGGGKKSGGILWLKSNDGNNGAVYAHVEFAQGISSNSKVKKGQKIASVARSCSTTKSKQCTKLGPHLHFEFYIDKKGLNAKEMRKLFNLK